MSMPPSPLLVTSENEWQMTRSGQHVNRFPERALTPLANIYGVIDYARLPSFVAQLTLWERNFL